MFLKAVFKLFIFDNIVSLWMLELHLAAYASLSDRSPSILPLPACRKLPFRQRRALGSPQKLIFLKFPFHRDLSCPGLSPHAVGQGRAGCDSSAWLCGTGRSSSGPAQIRTSPVHRATMILYLLFSSWGTGLPHHLSSSPSLPLLLSFAFNYFLISEEKEICGRRQF